MTAVALRATTAADLPFVVALERDAYNREYIGQWTDEEHLAAIRGESGRVHRIIDVDGRAAGYVITYDGGMHSPSVYVKRIVVGDKERGIGQAAMGLVLADAFSRPSVRFVWLLVREWNARAQAVYRKLGFERYDPPDGEAAALAAYAEAPGPQSFRMRVTSRRAVSAAPATPAR
jgi:diamine N-acetyltransferase